MSRPVKHPGGAYNIVIPMKVNAEALAVLDRLRGDTPRSTFLRELIRAENKRRRSN